MRSNGETGAAAAGCNRVGVANLEGLANQVIDEVDFCAAHEFKAEGIDINSGVVASKDDIVCTGFFADEVIFVLEARASATGDRDAQDRAGLFLGDDAPNALCGALCQNNLVWCYLRVGHIRSFCGMRSASTDL